MDSRRPVGSSMWRSTTVLVGSVILSSAGRKCQVDVRSWRQWGGKWIEAANAQIQSCSLPQSLQVYGGALFYLGGFSALYRMDLFDVYRQSL